MGLRVAEETKARRIRRKRGETRRERAERAVFRTGALCVEEDFFFCAAVGDEADPAAEALDRAGLGGLVFGLDFGLDFGPVFGPEFGMVFGLEF